MSGDPCDYSVCTLAELRDVAAHIDRLQFPERAARVDAEIRKREALPIHLQEPLSFRGGATFGDSAIFGRTVSWPFAELRFSTAELTLKAAALPTRSFVFSRGDVASIDVRQPILSRGLQIVHNRADYPPIIMFFSDSLDLIRRKLSERGWLVRSLVNTREQRD
jgi:hypothetical protein